MIGTTLHHYHILRMLGKGGMGEVYIAEDTKLHREIALKVLPRDLASDPELLHRFQREARAVAALNHPNVVTIYAVEEAEGVQFIAMELVEGKTLGNLIPQHGIALQEFLRLAVPLADAIAAAHQRGIVHRDLKPANIMVTAEGRLKVLDFGLAKLKSEKAGSPDATTMSDQLTAQHSVIGTPSYMSPEQAEGKPIDYRTDIFSVGVVLYEMATGTRPFKGESVVTILSSIIKDAPAPAVEVNPRLPRELDRIIMHCLAKDPTCRYQSALDLRNDLDELRRQAGEGVGLVRIAGRVLASSTRRRVRWVAALVLLSLLTSMAYLYLIRRPPRPGPPTVAQTTKLTSSPGVEQYPSLSPDGQWIVYSGWDSGHRRIYLQRIGGQTPIPIPKDSTSDDDQPAFSPDGERIAFRSSRDGGGLFVMGLTGEAIKRLTRIGFNPSWSPDGTKIVFATENVQRKPMNWEGVGKLWIVDVGTEELQRLSAEYAVQPSWSPNNHRIAYASRTQARPGQPRQMHIRTIPASGGESTEVTSGEATHWCPVWSRDGKYLYFASDRGGSMNLWRVPMDEESGKPTGEPEAIITPATFLAHPTVSADGKHIAYSSILESQNIQRIAFDPIAGKRTGEPEWITTGSRLWSSCDVSPDGQRLVFYSDSQPLGQLYISPTDGSSAPRQLTDGENIDRVPRWSPAADWIAFFSDRSPDGVLKLWKIRPDASGLRQITDVKGGIATWSPDGSRMAATGEDADGGGYSIYVFDPNRPWREQSPQVIPAMDAASGRRYVLTSWSPDSEKLVCQTGYNEGGSGQRLGIVTYSFKTQKFERLTEFGEWPVWLPDSRRILFVSEASDLFVIDSRSKEIKAESIYHVDRDRIGPPRMTQDGRFIYFTLGITEADIWLVDLD